MYVGVTIHIIGPRRVTQRMVFSLLDTIIPYLLNILMRQMAIFLDFMIITRNNDMTLNLKAGMAEKVIMR